MVTFYFRKNNNLDVLLNISFCRIPLSLLWARKCLHCALIFSLLARHAIFCWVHLSTQSLLAILLKLAHCKPQPFTQEKTYGGMLGDKPARWQQAVLAERYKGRGDREKGRERFVWVFLQLCGWVQLWVTSAQTRSFSNSQYVWGSEDSSDMTGPNKGPWSISHIYLNFTRFSWLMRWETFTTANVL